jgi:predicted ATPase/DNA-binding SARP family transcriptional activator
MRIHLTGRIAVEDGELVLDERQLPKRQGRVLFARLVLEGGPVHRDVLAETLWPDDLPSTWDRTLAGVLSRLRRTLSLFDGVSISNVSGSYRLDLPSEPEVDVAVAGSQCDAAERALAVGDAARAASSAAVSAAIARRPFLAGHGGAWVDAQRAELRTVLVRALEVGAEATLGTSECVALAGEAVELEPFREHANLLLIRAHHALGNTADALRAYERYRSLLGDELGADPGPDVRALHLELLGSQTHRKVEEMTRQGLAGLPTTHTTFVGRTDALAAVGALLRSQRLVTLTGAGGVGKTRMAIEVARRSIDVFPDGVWFADLAGLSADAPIVEHVAIAMGLRCASVQSLAAVLDRQQILLILDNCEQVLEPVAALAGALLASTTGPVLLATSRSPLRVDGEHVWRVPSMHVPAEGELVASAESVLLFCERAAAVRPDFELTSASAPAVASICTRLDGVPLAIELAAARISAMGAAEIAERLGDRFALLRAPIVGLPRHRTLRTAIDWSYDVLSADEAHVFRRLSVFEGSFTLEDAEAICDGNVGAEIASLAEHSLLVTDDGRYRVLETIKEYARERAEAAGEWTDCIDRHADRFVALVPQLESDEDQAGFLAALKPLRADATVALERALARGRVAEAIPLAAAMARFWLPYGLWTEGASFLDQTIEAARSAGMHRSVGPLLSWRATIAMNVADLDHAKKLYDEARTVATERGDDSALAGVLVDLASTNHALGRTEEAEDHVRRALELADRSGNDFAAGRALLSLGVLIRESSEHNEEAKHRVEQALERFARAGSQTGVARALTTIAGLTDPKAAPRAEWEEPLQRARGLTRQIEDRLTESIVLSQLGVTLAETGHLPEAIDALREALRLSRRIGNRRSALNCIEQIGLVAAERGPSPRAVTLLAAAAALRAKSSLAPSYTNMARVDELREHAMSLTGPDAGAVWTSGSELSFEEAYELAMSVTSDPSSAPDAPQA